MVTCLVPLDAANRLIAVRGPTSAVRFAYNGLGDRLSQTMNGQTTTYTLDLAAGLTQVLADGARVYLYGLARIAQFPINSPQSSIYYFLGDALGSVRQLVDEGGEVLLARAYAPYGETQMEITQSPNAAITPYGFTGEWTDATGLVYLRARYYSPWQGRFMTRDTWEGDDRRPASYIAWVYVYDNPTNMVDPTGLYGTEVHYVLTRRILYQQASMFPFKEALADVIAEWDLWVDFSPVLTSIGSCGSCHFMPYTATTRHIAMAICDGRPFLFGAALHQLQDFYSHWSEGYHDQFLGHGFHSIRAMIRSDHLLSDFYRGGHYEGVKRVESPFPLHPKGTIIDNIKNRNPGINLTGLSDWDYVDLYLRLRQSNMITESIMQMRDYFGFKPDLYVPTSERDRLMEVDTNFYISRFVARLSELYRTGCLNLSNIYVQPGVDPANDVLAWFFLNW